MHDNFDGSLTQLLDMDLYTEINISPYITVLRVPGGWIHGLFNEKGIVNNIFVPEPEIRSVTHKEWKSLFDMQRAVFDFLISQNRCE